MFRVNLLALIFCIVVGSSVIVIPSRAQETPNDYQEVLKFLN